MGKHCAARKPDVSMRLLLVSAAVLLATAGYAGGDEPPAKESTPRPGRTSSTHSADPIAASAISGATAPAS